MNTIYTLTSVEDGAMFAKRGNFSYKVPAYLYSFERLVTPKGRSVPIRCANSFFVPRDFCPSCPVEVGKSYRIVTSRGSLVDLIPA